MSYGQTRSRVPWTGRWRSAVLLGEDEEMITHLVAVSITLLLNIPRWVWEKAHQPETGVSYFAGLVHCVTVIDRKEEVLGSY